MTQTKKRIIIWVASAVVLTVLFNLLPNGAQVVATIAAGTGAVAGWLAKKFYDAKFGED